MHTYAGCVRGWVDTWFGAHVASCMGYDTLGIYIHMWGDTWHKYTRTETRGLSSHVYRHVVVSYTYIVLAGAFYGYIWVQWNN